MTELPIIPASAHDSFIFDEESCSCIANSESAVYKVYDCTLAESEMTPKFLLQVGNISLFFDVNCLRSALADTLMYLTIIPTANVTFYQRTGCFALFTSTLNNYKEIPLYNKEYFLSIGSNVKTTLPLNLLTIIKGIAEVPAHSREMVTDDLAMFLQVTNNFGGHVDLDITQYSLTSKTLRIKSNFPYIKGEDCITETIIEVLVPITPKTPYITSDDVVGYLKEGTDTYKFGNRDCVTHWKDAMPFLSDSTLYDMVTNEIFVGVEPKHKEMLKNSDKSLIINNLENGETSITEENPFTIETIEDAFKHNDTDEANPVEDIQKEYEDNYDDGESIDSCVLSLPKERRTLLHVSLESSEDYVPSDEDIQNVRVLFQEAVADDNVAVVVTNGNVRVTAVEI